jgi:hypothetical protein
MRAALRRFAPRTADNCCAFGILEADDCGGSEDSGGREDLDADARTSSRSCCVAASSSDAEAGGGVVVSCVTAEPLAE